MRQREHTLGRVVATLGIGFGLVYLVWRTVATIDGVPWWLDVPTLVVEFGGASAVTILSWALWRRPIVVSTTASPSNRDHRGGTTTNDVAIVIRSGHHDRPDLGELRATILASRHLGPVTVVDSARRAEVAAFAAEVGVGYLATASDDSDGLIAAARSVDTPWLFLLDAGDVPHPRALLTLGPLLDEPTVAIVQGPVVSGGVESAEHGVGERHDKDFERRALNPSLGARGVAALTGSGALIRTSSIVGISSVGSTPMVHAEITSSLFAAGWKILAPTGDPVVAVSSIASGVDVDIVRACEASAAHHMLFGSTGALRFNGLGFSQRVSLLSQAVRPFAGLRRSAILVLLIGALLAGRLPFEADPVVFASLWAPWFVLSALGLRALSGGRLRPGDRVRWSMRVLGSSWRGLFAPNGRPDPAEHVIGGAFGVHHGVAAAGAVAAICVVIAMRAISDRVTHTLAPMPTRQTLIVLVVALWSLAGGLDALRILARRAQSRRATRIVSSLPSTFADRAALVVDLTPLGAGVLAETDLQVGSRHQLDVVVPTATGCISASIPVIVRNSRVDFSGERRLGVEFESVDSHVADALTEYCVIQPALELLGESAVDPVLVGARTVVVLEDVAVGPRRIGLRAAALVAVAGAMASAVPRAEAAGPALRIEGSIAVSAQAFAGDLPIPTTVPNGAPSDVVPTTSDPGAPDATVPGSTSPQGAVVVAVCATDAGADGQWGTSDDAYGSPVSVTVAADGTFSLGGGGSLDGQVCWSAAAPPAGLMVPGETGELESAATPHVVDLTDDNSGTIEFVETVAPRQTATPPRTATVDDVVWSDINSDGVIDDNEPRVAGVSVTLLDAGGTVMGTDVTDGGGQFTFADVAEADYRLLITNVPNGLTVPTALHTTDALGRTDLFTVRSDGDVNLAIGLVPQVAPVAATSATPTAPTTRIFEAPDRGDLAPTPDKHSPLGTWLVVALAGLIGISVLAGAMRQFGTKAETGLAHA
jgi:SdrD B-like domain